MDSGLVSAIHVHAAALLEIAKAIREHTAAIVQVEDVGDDEAPPRTYMDGTPVQ